MNEKELAKLRAEIDSLDDNLIKLLNKRVKLAKEIGKLKNTENQPFFIPEREKQIHEKLVGLASDDLNSEQLTSIFREIISASRQAEKPIQVAYWGPAGTYTHQAAMKAFGRLVHLVECSNIRDVFVMVDRNQVDYGVVPVENSIGGVVPETLDMFSHVHVNVVSENFLDIHHNLGTHATSLADIKRVYAGPQPTAQCQMWLSNNLPDAEVISVAPTALAAKKASEDKQGAVLANDVCLELYQLPSLADHIEDYSNNKTRFLVIGQNEPQPSGNDKTSLMFKVRNRRGELYHILGCFLEHDVNLTMIESRPDPRGSSQYVFYVDCAGHIQDQSTCRAINDLRSVAIDTVVLGSYPSYDEGLKSL